MSAEIQKMAMNKAQEAWDALTATAPMKSSFDEEAFEAAMRAYLVTITHPVVNRQMPPPKADRPEERTVKEHFLALSTGHYIGYKMTPGRTGSVHRDLICFQPDPKSSILLPLFMSVHKVHDAVTDMRGRRLDVELEEE